MNIDKTLAEIHAIVSDALWIERYSDQFMESSCEMADWVLEHLGLEPIRDGVGPWPDHHHSSLADDAERIVSGEPVGSVEGEG